MSVHGFHRDMTSNRCFVRVGPDRIDRILNPSQFQGLFKGLSINLKTISGEHYGKKKLTVESCQDSGIKLLIKKNMDAEEIANQRRLPKKRLLKSFHLEEAAEREFNSPGKATCVQ